MTRLALLADIHGNLPALQAVLRDLEQFPVDQTIIAGDLIGRGPFTLEVLEQAVQAGWPLIRGNHELYILDHATPRAPDWASNNAMTPVIHRQLVGRWLTTMACWPDTLCLRFPDAPPLRIFHGTPQSAFDGIFHSDTDARLRDLLANVAEDTVVFAHTHLALDRTVDHWHILNPGSVGLPLDGIHTASYMLLDGDAHGWRATLRRVPFDYAALYDAFERTGIVATAGATGRLILHEFETARPQFTPFIRWLAVHYPGAAWSDALFDAFRAEHPWKYQILAYHVNVGQPHYQLDDGSGAPIDLRRATNDDLPVVLDILNETATWLTDRGIDQWQPGSFSPHHTAESIERGEIYLARQHGLDVGTLTVQWHDPTFWGERPLDAVYVHKLAVRRAAAGQGLGQRLLRWAETLATEADKSYVRLDCVGTNLPLRHFYTQAGFHEAGYIKHEHYSTQLFERKVDLHL